MADKIAIDQDVIVAHAARVERVASEIAIAKQASTSANMGGGAFGLMCSFLVPFAEAAAHAASTSIGEAGGMVSRSAVELRGVGADAAELESRLVASIRELGASLR